MATDHKFRVGDRVRHRISKVCGTILAVDDDHSSALIDIGYDKWWIALGRLEPIRKKRTRNQVGSTQPDAGREEKP